jgi:arginine/serine-rich splicing factor 4/5/6
VKGNFGFVTYADERDAEEAMKECKNKEVRGSRINVEWAKGSGRYDGSSSSSSRDTT